MLAGAQADDPAEIESARAALTAAEEELERDQKEKAALGDDGSSENPLAVRRHPLFGPSLLLRADGAARPGRRGGRKGLGSE